MDNEGEEVPPEAVISATFELNQLSGNSGCNTYGTVYELSDDDGMTISPAIAATMMACPDPIGLQESLYLSILALVKTYDVTADTLFLKNEAGDIILSYMTQKPISLTGTEWELISYNNGKEAVVSVVIGSEVTAMFTEENKMSGSGGCNNYNASYETEGKNMTVGPAMSTQMFCNEPEGVMDQEVQYLQVLDKVSQYVIEGNTLRLMDENGARLAIYNTMEDSMEEVEN